MGQSVLPPPPVGGRVKEAVCQVRLDFIHSIRLADPCGLLKGDVVSKRFVTIRSVADAERPEVTAALHNYSPLHIY